MARMTNNICVFDFETGGSDPFSCDPIELSALIYDCRKLEPIPGATFNSLLKPLDFDKLQQKALDVNKITREELQTAPEQSVVWKQFVEFINFYNPRKNNWFSAPIAAGLNIKGFDMNIIARLCASYGPQNKEKNGQGLFYPRNSYDLLDIMALWFNDEDDPPNFKLDTLREFFGLSKDGSHRALKDVEDSGHIIMRFLKLKRNLKNIKYADGRTLRQSFKGAFCAN